MIGLHLILKFLYLLLVPVKLSLQPSDDLIAVFSFSDEVLILSPQIIVFKLILDILLLELPQLLLKLGVGRD